MKSYIEVKAHYLKTLKTGQEKNVKEHFLTEADTCDEATNIVLEELGAFGLTNFEVDTVKKSNIVEVLNDSENNPEKWYKAKLAFVTLDERTAKEKRESYFFLVQAADFERAVALTKTFMKFSASDYEIQSISETAFVDVFSK